MCEYCREKDRKELYREEYFIDFENIFLITEIRGEMPSGWALETHTTDEQCLDHDGHIYINYCPMCGRKLGE